MFRRVEIVVVGEIAGDFNISTLHNWSDIEVYELEEMSEERAVSEDDPAAIIFTSGTRGQRNGVTLSHRNLYSNTLSILEYLGLTNQDKTVNFYLFIISMVIR